ATAIPVAGATAANFTFGDSLRISGIAGTVSYTGSLLPVGSGRPLVVKAYADPYLTISANAQSSAVTQNNGVYNIATFDSNTYYLVAFLDLNGDGNLEAGKPYEIYQNQTYGNATAVVAGPSNTNT